MDKTGNARRVSAQEIAEDVYWLAIYGSNVYFVRSGPNWFLVDAAWGNCARVIKAAAAAVFGQNVPPRGILLTHDHPDHVGAALELARTWECPIYVHPDELTLTTATDLSTIEQYANPMDRWVILPIMRALPQRWVKSMISRGSFEGVVEPLEPDRTVSGLSEWTWIPTPGHSPGHVAFFREKDRVLISGDALLTVDLDSFRGWLSLGSRKGRPRTSLSPWYTNWDQQAAEESAAALIGMKPNVIASGHGSPLRMNSTEDDALCEATCANAFQDALPEEVGNHLGFSFPTRGVRASVFVINGLVAVTSIGGGIALATGLESDRFPLNWL